MNLIDKTQKIEIIGLAYENYSRLYSRQYVVRLTKVSVRSLGQVQRAKLASRSADNSVSKREPTNTKNKHITTLNL